MDPGDLGGGLRGWWPGVGLSPGPVCADLGNCGARQRDEGHEQFLGGFCDAEQQFFTQHWRQARHATGDPMDINADHSSRNSLGGQADSLPDKRFWVFVQVAEG
ncbi:hypothetical protein GCM10027030_08880 [Luteococcus sediminum]